MRIRGLLLAATLLLAANSFAQRTTCELVGSVTDSSGAVVPGADVTITNTANGITRTGKTNDQGEYRFPDLLPGGYTLQVASSGFKTASVQPFKLYVDQAARQDVKLELGATSQTITVTAGNVALETENATEGQVVENKEIQDLPLNGRQFVQLAELAAGAGPSTYSMSSAWSGGTPSVSIGGLREDDVSYLYDGIETRNSWYGAVGLQASIDAIQEFKVEATGSSSAYGGGGAFINVITKSGTNGLHGTAYEFLRNNDVDSRNYFDIGAPPPFRQNQFGGSVGGPIKKDKLFFFGNYEGFRQVSPGDTYTRVPTSAQKSGDFSALLPTTQLMNPFTGEAFPGNVISPSSLISPIATKIFNFFPAPNGSYLGGGDNYFVVTNGTNSWNQATGRIDYNVSDKDRLFFRYTQQSGTILQPGITADGYSTFPAAPKNLDVGWSRSISARILNELRLGWNYSENGDIRAHGYDSGFANPYGLTYPGNTPGSYGLPTLGFAQGYANPAPFQGTNIVKDHIIMATDSVLIQKGRHSINVGADIRYNPIYQYENWASSSISFNGSYTGDSIGDLMLGIPQSAGSAIGDPTLHWRRWYQAYYVNDSVKLTPRLTLNYGLRWEYRQPPVETRNHVGSFDYATGTMLTYPDTKVLGLGRQMVFPDRKNFSPRLGLAWVPFDKNTVIRAGYGIYYLQANINQYEQEVDTPKLYLDYGFSNNGPGKPLVFGLADLFNTALASPFTLVAFEDPHNKTPYSEQWNLSIEHTFPGNWLLELVYQGSVGHHIEERPQINPPLPDGTTPWANYTGGIALGENGGNSNYNALDVRLEKHYSSGLSFLGTYSYSKCLDYPWQDQFTAHPLDMRLDYGNCLYDVNHRLVVSSVYELPFGKGKRYLNGGAWSNILGGWEVSEIAQFATGPWGTPGGPNYVGTLVSAVSNVVGPLNNGSLRSSVRQHNGGPYFNIQNVQGITDCCGFQGDASQGSIVTPGTNNWDLSVFKAWRLFERGSLTFRTDFFNAFNHAQFGCLDTGWGDPTFGQVTCAGAAREIQFSLRLSF